MYVCGQHVYLVPHIFPHIIILFRLFTFFSLHTNVVNGEGLELRLCFKCVYTCTVQVIKKFSFQITLRLRYNLITIVKRQCVHRFTIAGTEIFTLRQPITRAHAAKFKGHAQNMHVTRVKIAQCSSAVCQRTSCASLYAVVGNKRKRLAQLRNQASELYIRRLPRLCFHEQSV